MAKKRTWSIDEVLRRANKGNGETGKAVTSVPSTTAVQTRSIPAGWARVVSGKGPRLLFTDTAWANIMSWIVGKGNSFSKEISFMGSARYDEDLALYICDWVLFMAAGTAAFVETATQPQHDAFVAASKAGRTLNLQGHTHPAGPSPSVVDITEHVETVEKIQDLGVEHEVDIHRVIIGRSLGAFYRRYLIKDKHVTFSDGATFINEGEPVQLSKTTHQTTRVVQTWGNVNPYGCGGVYGHRGGVHHQPRAALQELEEQYMQDYTTWPNVSDMEQAWKDGDEEWMESVRACATMQTMGELARRNREAWEAYQALEDKIWEEAIQEAGYAGS